MMGMLVPVASIVQASAYEIGSDGAVRSRRFMLKMSGESNTSYGTPFFTILYLDLIPRSYTYVCLPWMYLKSHLFMYHAITTVLVSMVVCTLEYYTYNGM